MNAGDIITFDVKKNFSYVKKLGSGGTGDTHLFKDETTNMIFAIKKYVPKDLKHIDEYYERFVEEIKILFNISHPNIVRIYNYYLYPQAKTGFLQMEYIDGVCIDEYEPMPWDSKGWEDIFYDTVNAFYYLEKHNILHRDIRPTNFLIDNTGNIKIIDFGFGKRINGSGTEKNSILLNWPATEMPNEVVLNQEYDKGTEIYYLGTLFRHVLKEKIKSFRFQHILDKMIKIDPEQRYVSFADVLFDINSGALSEINFTEEQRKCYREFADALCSHINYYSRAFSPIDDPDQILSKLAEAIRKSALEEYIQDNTLLINCFVEGGYNYKIRNDIEVKNVIDFYYLLMNLDSAKKQLILENINTRLASIRVEIDDLDLPF